MASVELSEKICPKCETWKPEEEFARDAGRKDRLYFCCRECHTKQNKKWHRITYDHAVQRGRNIQYSYGLSPEEQRVLELAQGDLCAACSQSEMKLDHRTNKIKNFNIDHDHKTGKVRALLCHSYNVALGLLQDDPERIRMLLEYAERYCDCSSKED